MALVYLDKKENREISFVKESVRVDKVITRTGDIEQRDYILIMLKNLKTGVSVPHPLTEFLRKWRNCSYSTIERRATEIIPFLNYILIDNAHKYGVSCLWEIMFEHGEDFLNEIGIGKARKTVVQYESTLTEFYYFLAKKKFLENISEDNFSIVEKKIKGRIIKQIISPFENVEYPRKLKNKNILHHLPKELIFAFIDTAIVHTPRIALGVYFQFFGGLRIGEVVNLTRESIISKGAFGENGLILNVKKRDLRPDLLNNRGKGEVKKPRYQVIINVNELMVNLLKNHLQTYKYNKETGAIFLNKRGLAMTEEDYRYYFSTLKKKFIERLTNSNNTKMQGYAVTLYEKKWSSHIGRGVFSNLIADMADNATQIALARGDSSLEAALSYVSDSSKVIRKVEDNLNSLYKNMCI